MHKDQDDREGGKSFAWGNLPLGYGFRHASPLHADILCHTDSGKFVHHRGAMPLLGQPRSAGPGTNFLETELWAEWMIHRVMSPHFLGA
jgi:hypothetical protein